MARGRSRLRTGPLPGRSSAGHPASDARGGPRCLLDGSVCSPLATAASRCSPCMTPGRASGRPDRRRHQQRRRSAETGRDSILAEPALGWRALVAAGSLGHALTVIAVAELHRSAAARRRGRAAPRLAGSRSALARTGRRRQPASGERADRAPDPRAARCRSRRGSRWLSASPDEPEVEPGRSRPISGFRPAAKPLIVDFALAGPTPVARPTDRHCRRSTGSGRMPARARGATRARWIAGLAGASVRRRSSAEPAAASGSASDSAS